MKTIIVDIDGTLTDMWPIEKCVLSAMLGNQSEKLLEQLKQNGISSCYSLFTKVSPRKISKRAFFKTYNNVCYRLQANNSLPIPIDYPIVSWIKENNTNFQFVFATGGQTPETEYVLESLNIKKYFDIESSVSKSNYPFSKKTGILFRKIKKKYPDCLLITDSQDDCLGAIKANISFLQIIPQSRGEDFEKLLSTL